MLLSRCGISKTHESSTNAALFILASRQSEFTPRESRPNNATQTDSIFNRPAVRLLGLVNRCGTVENRKRRIIFDARLTGVIIPFTDTSHYNFAQRTAEAAACQAKHASCAANDTRKAFCFRPPGGGHFRMEGVIKCFTLGVRRLMPIFRGLIDVANFRNNANGRPLAVENNH